MSVWCLQQLWVCKHEILLQWRFLTLSIFLFWDRIFFGPMAVVRVCLSFRPSICCVVFLKLLVLLKFWHFAGNPYAWQSRIFQKKLFVPKIGKVDRKWAKNRVLWIYWKIWSLVFLNLFYNENVIILCSCRNPVFREIFVPEIWAKIRLQDFLINQIFCMMIQIHINYKLTKNFLVGYGQK